MLAGNILFLCIAVGSLALLGGVLAWASWMEAREERQKALARNVQANPNEKTSRIGRVQSARINQKIASRPF